MNPGSALGIQFRLRFEIMVMVKLAAGIELRLTLETPIAALHVLPDRQLDTANSAEDCFLIPLQLGPNFNRVIGQGFMALFASIINSTTLHFDGDDVRGAVVMLATGVGIEINTANCRDFGNHRVVKDMPSIRWLVIPRRNHRSAWLDRQNGSPKSSAVFDLDRPVCACD